MKGNINSLVCVKRTMLAQSTTLKRIHRPQFVPLRLISATIEAHAYMHIATV